MRGTNRGNSRGRGGRGGRNTERKMPNKDELDAQLDSIIKNKNNWCVKMYFYNIYS